MVDLYDQIVRRYRGQLEALVPVVEIPVRIGNGRGEIDARWWARIRRRTISAVASAETSRAVRFRNTSQAGGLDLPDQQRNRRRPAQLTRHKEIGEPPGGQLGVGPAA